MNKRCVALSDEQYRECIKLLREGFVLEGCNIKPNPRIAVLEVLQASLGLRLGDAIQLRMSSFVKDNGRWRLDIKEQKTGKVRDFTVPVEIYSFIQEYALNMGISADTKLFDISERQVERHLNKVFSKMGLPLRSYIKRWQKEIKKKNYSDTYLWSINTQLNAIFNHAMKFYKLSYNPCKGAGFMGKSKSGNMGIWSQDEMEQFLEAVKDKPVIYYAFFLMYWTGLRVGELLALNINDIDMESGVLSVTKSLNRVKSEDIISEPKTESSIREIPLPEFVVEKMREYINMLFGRSGCDRLFAVTKSHLEKEIKRGAEVAGLKKIRVHDLRHSHASLLISQGVDIATISSRLGHEKSSTTLNIRLFMDGKLNEYLHEVDEECHERMELLVEQMKAGAGIMGELKASDQMKGVGLMNNVRSVAEEAVIRELIYV